ALAALRARADGDADEDARQPTVLLLGCLLAPLVIIALPWTPIFGGTKHWFTAYPFLALFAGAGVDRALDRATAALSLRAPRLAPRL
ncbi:hypothetical protein, partial [Enterococcus casseliflavus]|uniref:hypothetical protein n=1 Tax=Enterococcus casseliflavus TaxID=37734 RepID=UPI003D098407